MDTVRDFALGLWIIWSTRRRLGGVKDPTKATPADIERLGSAMAGIVKGATYDPGPEWHRSVGLDLPVQSQTNSLSSANDPD